MDNTFVDLLREAQSNETLIGVFSDPSNPSAFAAGWVEAVSDEHLVLRHVSQHGRYDGYRLVPLENVFRVDSTGRYLERLRFLSQVREERFPHLFKSGIAEDANLVVEILLAAQQNDLLVLVSVLEGSDLTGWIKQIGHDTVIITLVDNDGVSDFDSTVHLEAITAVYCNDEDLQDLRLLARRNEAEPPGWLKI
jgi:hypothetical protein